MYVSMGKISLFTRDISDSCRDTYSWYVADLFYIYVYGNAIPADIEPLLMCHNGA